jgi:predicted acyl esterase
MHNDSLILYLGSAADSKLHYSLLKNKPDNINYNEQEVDLKTRTDIRFKEGAISAFEKLIDSTLTPDPEKLIFVSDPVDIPFAISGSFKASFKISINKKDFDLVLDLYEQTPDGRFFALNENVQRASYANDRTKRELLQPEKIEIIKMTNTFITSRQLQKGSRIVVLLGVNKSPEWQVNYGTGNDVSDETITDATSPLKIKWYNTSYIQFPILR